MKIKLSFITALLIVNIGLSQSDYWQRINTNSQKLTVSKHKTNLPLTTLFSLDVNDLKKALNNSPLREKYSKSNTILSFPNEKGEMESFRVFEAPVLHPDLAAKYPDIKSYAGQGVNDPSATIRFSISPAGLSSMRLSGKSKAVFIETLSTNSSIYSIYSRDQKSNISNKFKCLVENEVSNKSMNKSTTLKNADDGILRRYRLAVSTTGEYSQFHINDQGIAVGATDVVKKAAVLNAINATMTRVNGIFERDFAVTMELIANTDDVIFLSEAADPYSDEGSFNFELQNTLTITINDFNYDIGHLFGLLPDRSGHAGCIRCVCINGQKGGGFTVAPNPQLDFFDIIVAHEMGHQFGGNHTYTFRPELGTGAQMEPGSGSTIMSYAGITGATDVQAIHDTYFHAKTIQQITDYVKSTACQTDIPTGNAIPVANAGSDYNIPRGTPFALTGEGNDANPADALTYCWEQMDENGAAHAVPNTANATGVSFRSYNPTTSKKRYFPRLETIKTGATFWEWEAIPNVSRDLNFRLTVRDNRVNGGANHSDDMKVVVTDAAGPFLVTVPNTNVVWSAGDTKTITWDVAGTNANGINAANVDILLSTDGGNTYPVELAMVVPNDGSHDVIIPNQVGTENRIMIKGTGNIFFDISDANFEIEATLSTNESIFQNFSYFPNPTENILHVTLNPNSLEENINIRLHDISGRIVYSMSQEATSNFSTTLNLPKLTSGIYLMDVSQGNRNQIAKIIIK